MNDGQWFPPEGFQLHPKSLTGGPRRDRSDHTSSYRKFWHLQMQFVLPAANPLDHRLGGGDLMYSSLSHHSPVIRSVCWQRHGATSAALKCGNLGDALPLRKHWIAR